MLTLTSQARAYFDDIKAPAKHMEMISDAGHFAAFLQPGQFLEKLLSHVRSLAYAPSHVVRTPTKPYPSLAASTLSAPELTPDLRSPPNLS